MAQSDSSGGNRGCLAAWMMGRETWLREARRATMSRAGRWWWRAAVAAVDYGATRMSRSNHSFRKRLYRVWGSMVVWGGGCRCRASCKLRARTTSRRAKGLAVRGLRDPGNGKAKPFFRSQPQVLDRICTVVSYEAAATPGDYRLPVANHPPRPPRVGMSLCTPAPELD